MKRIMNLWIFILLATLLLCGCSNEKKDIEESGKVIEGSIDGSVEGNSDGSVNNKYTVKEYTEEEVYEIITNTGKPVVTWVYSSQISGFDANIKLAVNDRIENLGYDFVINFVQVEDDNFESTVEEMISSDNPPDVITTGTDEGSSMNRIYQAYTNEWFDFLENYFNTDEGGKIKKSMPDFMWETCKVNGEIIGVGCNLIDYNEVDYMINMDLTDKYEISEEDIQGKSYAELSEVFEMISSGEENCDVLWIQNDTDENIEKYIIGLTGVSIPDLSDFYSGLVLDYASESEMIENLFENERAVEYFKCIAEYRQEGIVCFGDEHNGTSAFLTADYWDIRVGSDGYIMNFYETYPDISGISSIMTENSVYKNQVSLNGICRTSLNKELALKALMVTVTDKTISDLLLYGIEGRDYEFGATSSEVVTNRDRMPFFGNPFVSRYDNYDTLEEMYINYEVYKPCTLGVYINTSDYKEMLKTHEEIVSEYIWGLLHGEYEDVDATLEELNDRLYENGLQELLDYLNKQL